MTQRFRKIDVSESINSNDIVSTSINSLYNTTGIQKCKELYCDSLKTGNIDCTNISIGGTILGTGIGGSSEIKTSYNISNSINFFELTSIDYDIYTSYRNNDINFSIQSIFDNIANDNQLKKFYIYIENCNDTTTNPLAISLNLLVNPNNYSNIFYEEWTIDQSDVIKKLRTFSIFPSYEIQPEKYIILEIIPFIYPKYNLDFELLGNDLRLVIKDYTRLDGGNTNTNTDTNNKTSYNISNEILDFYINSINYDIYTSSRISDISIFLNITMNEINLLKTFYIQIENTSTINPINITFNGSGQYHKLSTEDTYLKSNQEIYTLPQYNSIYLFEITPIIYPSFDYNLETGSYLITNKMNYYIKSYKHTGPDGR